MPTRNVVLTDHQSDFLDRLVEEGRYQNASEAMRAGLRQLEDLERQREVWSAIGDNALKQIETGDFAPMGEVMDRVFGKYRDAAE